MTPDRRRELLAASRLGLSVLAGGDAHFYNADQPRAEDGRWTSTAMQGGMTAAIARPGDVLRAGRRDVPPGLASASRNWADGMTPDGRGAVMKFTTGEHHDDFNLPLRKDADPTHLTPQIHREAAALDAAIRSFQNHVPLTSWRGLTTSTPEHLAAIEDGLKAALASGGVLTTNGFTSSTLDPGLAAQSGPVVLEIKSDRGAYLGSAARHPETLEVLHTHGEQFRVTGVHETTYGDTETGWTAARRTYTLEALPVGPPPFPPAPPVAEPHPGRFQRLGSAVAGWLSHAEMSAPAAFGWNENQPRGHGRFAEVGGGPAGGGATAGGATAGTHDVAGLYGRAADPSVTEAHIKDACAGLSKLSKADVLKVAADVGLSVPKSHSKAAVVKGITDRLLDRKGVAIRAKLTRRPDPVDPPPAAPAKPAKPAKAAKAPKDAKAVPAPASPAALRKRLADAEQKVKAAHAELAALRKAAKPPKAAKPAGKLPKTIDAKPVKVKTSGGSTARTPKAAKPPAEPHAATAARIKGAVDEAVAAVKKNAKPDTSFPGQQVPGDYDEARIHKVFDDALAAAKSKKDLVGLLAHLRGGGPNEKLDKHLAGLPRPKLEQQFYNFTRGMIGMYARNFV